MSSHNAARSARIELRQRRVPEVAAVGELHDEERRADDAAVVAIAIGARHRHVGPAERRDHAVLAIDGVRRRQELAFRLLAQDVRAAVGAQAKRGIGLPAAQAARSRSGRGSPARARASSGERSFVELRRHGNHFNSGGIRGTVSGIRRAAIMRAQFSDGSGFALWSYQHEALSGRGVCRRARCDARPVRRAARGCARC